MKKRNVLQYNRCRSCRYSGTADVQLLGTAAVLTQACRQANAHLPSTRTQPLQVVCYRCCSSSLRIPESLRKTLIWQITQEKNEAESSKDFEKSRIVVAENLPEDHCYQTLMKIFLSVGRLLFLHLRHSKRVLSLEGALPILG